MGFDLDTQNILSSCLAGGGQLSELYMEKTSGLSVIMDDGKVERVVAGSDLGAGLRLIYDLKTAYAHTNQVSQDGLMPLAKNLSAMAGGEAAPMHEARQLKPGLVNPIAKAPESLETRRKVEMVRAAEAAAREVDSRIKQVRVIYRDLRQEVRVANSLGVDVSDERVQVVMAVNCVAEQNGDMQTGYEVTGGAAGLEVFDQVTPEKVGRIAAKRAILMLEADPAPGGAMPVVLHSAAGGTMIHEAVGHGLEADHINENMSVYAGRIGRQVASPLISVVDDGTIAGKRGSFGFDDEGYPSQRNLLIEKGVLKRYMQDRLSAMKMETAPSGNGRRESYLFCPVPRMTNTMILPGGDDPESIIRRTPQGLLVYKMGGGQVNPVNGDFVFEVSEGYLIKDGKIGAPVRGATLTGNGPQVLSDIDLVGSDLGFGLGTCGKDGQGAPVADAQPTLRIPQIVVGGQQ
jgi:TldD protein